MFACPFLPSTCAILQQDEKLSTPKVGANDDYFCVRIFLRKQRDQAFSRDVVEIIQSQFTSFSQNRSIHTIAFEGTKIGA
jgi:hypothetical protein